MAFLQNPPALPARPGDWDDTGLTGGRQAECVYGKFGDPNSTTHSMNSLVQQLSGPLPAVGITGMSSGGMSACSAVFLRCEDDDGSVIGAVIHFDGSGDPGEMFRKVLGYYNQNNEMGVVLSQTYLATHNLDMTGRGAFNSLERAGFLVYGQFRHNGAACMDVNGNIFNHYA